MDSCARCNTCTDDLKELARFASEGGLAIEHVCGGCCTRVEAVITDRTQHDLGVMAFVLELTDAVGRLHLQHLERTRHGNN